MNLKKIIRLLLLSLIMIILINCSGTITDDPSGNSSTDDLYLITINGDLSNLSQNDIDAEYNTFLFLSNETDRKIYLGGKYPGSSSTADVVCLTNSSIWGSTKCVQNIRALNDYTYYSAEILPTEIPIFSSNNEHTINTQLADEHTDVYPYTYTSIGTSGSIIFKIAEFDARNWYLHVYQQNSYNSFNLGKDVIENAFSKMNVNFSELSMQNSQLLTEDIDWNLDDYTQHADNTMLQYAYRKVYPDITNTSVAIAEYASQYPNHGLLFFIQNYHVTTTVPDPNYQGLTFAQGSEVTRLPVVAFICAGKIKNNWHNDWEDKVITAVAVHELGHLWCEGFTNQDTHTLWHNGSNQNQCIMIDPFVRNSAGNPDDKTKNILTFNGFCEGHLQRGMNVSWKLKHYSPFGQTITPISGNLYASITNFDKSLNSNKLSIELTCKKNDFIKGELIDILINVKNNTSDTLKISNRKDYLINNRSLEIINGQFNNQRNIKIPPYEEDKYIINPLGLINYKDDNQAVLPSLPWYYWPEGDYEYYVSYQLNEKEYFSNKIPISVKAVPDTLLQAFNDLKEDMKNPATINFDSYKCLKYEILFEKYRYSYFEKEYYTKLLTNWNYYDALDNKKEAISLRDRSVSLCKEYILKYPDTETAQKLFLRILNKYEVNKILVEEIISDLRKNNNNSFLLQTIENRRNAPYKFLNNYFK